MTTLGRGGERTEEERGAEGAEEAIEDLSASGAQTTWRVARRSACIRPVRVIPPSTFCRGVTCAQDRGRMQPQTAAIVVKAM
jgi:hypothetical protein